MRKYGGVATSSRIFDGYQCESYKDEKGKLRVASSNILNPSNTLDISWLPAAAEKYNISSNIQDYVITEVPIVTVDVPNRNLDCFPFDEVSSFNPRLGKFVYKSFVGKPTYKEHDNRDHTKARGVHLDAQLQPVAGGGHKIIVLLAWDKTKDKELVDAIVKGKRTGYSMGAMVSYTKCSYPKCGATSGNGKIPCTHHNYGKGKGRIINGYLIYEICMDIDYFETSSVADPADHTAHSSWMKPWSS